MKISNWTGLVLLLSAFALGVLCAAPLPVSQINSALTPPAGGNGDSGLPIVSANGRFLLFASTADNLVSTNAVKASPFPSPTRINVFLRDRASNTTVLVSCSLVDPGGGNGDSLPLGISTNGRYALFESSASDLITSDQNNASDVFVRDLVSNTTLLVSSTTNGNSGNGASRRATLTPDGRFVAFVSTATNLVASDTNRIPDVYVRDLELQTTTLASVDAISTSIITPTGSSEAPVISADGRYVAFYSTASNLMVNVKSVGEVFVRDLVGENTSWASTNARSVMQFLIGSTNVVSYNQRISDDGQFIAFATSTNTLIPTASRGAVFRYSLQSGLTDLVHTNASAVWSAFEDNRGLDMTPDGRFITFLANQTTAPGSNTAVYVWDAQTGTNTLVSPDLDSGLPAVGIHASPSINSSGRFVAFLSTATNLTTNMLSGEYQLYLRDTLAGMTQLLNASTNGISTSVSQATVTSLSSDGGFVAFEVGDGNLVANDSNHHSDIVLRDMLTGTMHLISMHDPAFPSQTPNGSSLLTSACVSSNGLFVAFASDADNLVTNDANGLRDAFVRDIISGTTVLVSANTNGAPGDGMSSEAAISADGRYVTFTSWATNLAVNDGNNAPDVFVRDLLGHTTTLASVNLAGTGSGNGSSGTPAISTDGRHVLFRSKALNLATGPFTATENLFLRDQQFGTTTALTTSGCTGSAMTPDGSFVAFIGGIPSTSTRLYVWDSQAALRVYTNSAPSPARVAISPDGQFLAYLAGSPPQLSVADRIANSNWVVSAGTFPAHPGLRFSRDGRFLTYATTASNIAADTNGYSDVYVYDVQTRTNFLVGGSFVSSGSLNGTSDAPDISADGRFVAYRSFASNSLPADLNNSPDLFVFDRFSGATTLVSVNQPGISTANHWSLSPCFNHGQTLVFQSVASDLVNRDFNRSVDIFTIAFSSAGTNPTNAAAELHAQIVFGAIPNLNVVTPDQSPVIIWPAIPGISYRLQFKNDLIEPDWQDFDGNVALIGTNGYAIDLAPASGQRFYRFNLGN